MITIIMAAILSNASVDNHKMVERRFAPYQIEAIYHEHRKALAKKSVRIGYTYAKAFRAVRNSLMKRKHTTLFTSKDQVSSFEFIETCEEHLEVFNHKRSVILREREDVSMPILDEEGRDTGLVEKVTMSKIVTDNGSRILSFSSNPTALRAFGGDVYWDEAAFHKNGKQMWAAIQGRIRMGYDVDVWSSLSMEDTMFDVIAADAQSGKGGWHFTKIDIYDAVEQGLVEMINEWRDLSMTREQFIADAKEDAILPDLFALEYEIRKSNTLAPIVEWEVLKAAEKAGLRIERAHLSQGDIETLFGRAEVRDRGARRRGVETWMSMQFADLFKKAPGSRRYRIGFDVAASRKGDLASVWVDERTSGGRARHRALLTFRTEDWDVMQWCLEILMAKLPGEVVGRGDETGLGRQICWNLSKLFYGRFEGVNFSARKSDIGVALMSQLAAHRSELSPDHPDITQDLYCIRKGIKEDRVYFFESKNDLLPASHADIGWSSALAAYADLDQSTDVWVMKQS
jgi:phage FluMu gp28-like protein